MAENIEFISAAALPTTEAESVEVLCLENGALKKKAADGLGGGGSIFIIDTTADDYSTSNTAYGDKVKEALLSGKTIYFFDGTDYGTIGSFSITSSTAGEFTLTLVISTKAYMFGNTSCSPKTFAISGV